MYHNQLTIFELAQSNPVTSAIFISFATMVAAGIILGLLSWRWLKDRFYLHFTLYIFTVLLVSFTGVLVFNFNTLTESELTRIKIGLFNSGLVNITLFFFTRSLVSNDIKNFSFRIFKLSVVFATMCDVVSILYLTELTLKFRGVAVLFLMTAILILLYQSIKSKNYVKWYIFGIKIFILFSTPYILLSSGIISELNNLTASIPLVGVTTQIFLFIVGIIDRLRFEYESRLKAAQLQLLGSNANEVFHEVITPLTVILHYSQSTKKMAKRILDPNFSRTLESNCEKVIQSCDRITSNIDRYRNLANFNESKSKKDTVPINDLLSNVIEITKLKLKKRNQSFHFQNTFSSNVNVYGNKFEIEQILINLIFNASDAIENLDEKWIKINTQKLNNSIQITVSDSGRGIPTDIRQQIFTPFFTTKDKSNGSGLGLSICKKFAKENGGDLILDTSETNTTFILTLPLLIQ